MQLPLFTNRNSTLAAAVETLAAADVRGRGSVYTRREVVDFILDLLGYTPDKPLWTMSILEPSFGDGDFLLPIVERLLESCRLAGMEGGAVAEAIFDSVAGVELHKGTFDSTYRTAVSWLVAAGCEEGTALAVVGNWLRNDDFLLWPAKRVFDYVAGNPPYVRLELIPEPLLREYLRNFATMTDRADIYIAFFEKSLRLLKPNGSLGFICSDRWLKNTYGRRLRAFISNGFDLSTYVDMAEQDAFLNAVAAYAGVFVIRKRAQQEVRIASKPRIERETLTSLAMALKDNQASRYDEADNTVARIKSLPGGGAPWVLDGGGALDVIRGLESRFPTLEEAGCHVSIGVATGCDRVYIGKFDELPVEEARKLPLVMAGDLQNGKVCWSGLGVVNPFLPDGTLARFEDFPRFAAFLTRHQEALKERHVAKKSSANWYRTIDRMYPELVGTAKILVPDIKNEPNYTIDHGGFYPHHNVYYILSGEWPLQALCNVLRTSVARAFIAAYSVKMRGGYVRFQAQNLRRVRIPLWRDVAPETKSLLRDADAISDAALVEEIVAHLYCLNAGDVDALCTLFQ